MRCPAASPAWRRWRGDALRTFRAPGASLHALVGAPVLLVCMTDDDGPNTRCALNAANQRAPRRGGVGDVVLEQMPGGHALDLAALAPRLDAWMRTHPRLRGE